MSDDRTGVHAGPGIGGRLSGASNDIQRSEQWP